MVRSGFVVVTAGAVLAALLPATSGAAAEPAPAPAAVQPAAPQAPDVARGLVVKTRADDTTVQDAVQRSVGSDVDVQAPAELSGAVSTVDFDEPVPLAEAAEAAREVAQRPDVEWAVPNGRVRAFAASPVPVNDPLFGRQHPLWDASERASGTRTPGGYSAKAPAAWRSTSGRGTVVAVLDTGVRGNHPDLKGRLVRGYDMVGTDLGADGRPLPRGHRYRFYTANDGNGRDADPSDPGDWVPRGDTRCYGARTSELEPSSWHGTHVAGIVAARRNDRTGVVGVAPEAKVQPVRVLGRCGGWDSDIVAGMVWASGGSVRGVPRNRTPADVINLSLGTDVSGERGRDRIRADYCRAYGDIALAALRRGTVTVAAAGNDLADANYTLPAACPHVLSVAATSRKGRAAFYTNRGSSVDLAAPGGDEVVDGRGNGFLSTVDRGTTRPSRPGWAEYMGTSMAAPVVSGAAALLLSRGVSPSRVEQALRSSTSGFAPRSSSSQVTRFPVRAPDGRTRTVDLNCSTSTCGRGILDLSRAALPIARPVVQGAPLVGETLTVRPGTWVAADPQVSRQWLRDGEPVAGATGTSYLLTEADRTARISVVERSRTSGFEELASTSAATQEVGVEVVAAVPTSTAYTAPFEVGATVRDASGPLEGRTVRFTSGTRVLAEGVTGPDGSVRAEVPARLLDAGRRSVVATTTDELRTWTSAARTITVAQVRSAVAHTVPSSVRTTSRIRLRFTVTAAGVPGPRGQVQVWDGRRRLATVSLTPAAAGRGAVTLPRLPRGRHAIRTVYVGSTNVAGSSTASRTVTAR